MAIRAVYFDVGETLVDESRIRRVWAEWIGISVVELERALAEAIRRKEHHRVLFDKLRHDFDLARARLSSGNADQCQERDVYPDVEPCLRKLQQLGYSIGIAGNQPVAVEAVFRSLGLPVDVFGSSQRWKSEKPSRSFFERLISDSGFASHEIVYVGDRIDNDVLPARAVGMMAAFIKRGPWAAIHSGWPEADRANIQINSLEDLPGALARIP